jgi:hypothetical protein
VAAVPRAWRWSSRTSSTSNLICSRRQLPPAEVEQLPPRSFCARMAHARSQPAGSPLRSAAASSVLTPASTASATRLRTSHKACWSADRKRWRRRLIRVIWILTSRATSSRVFPWLYGPLTMDTPSAASCQTGSRLEATWHQPRRRPPTSRFNTQAEMRGWIWMLGPPSREARKSRNPMS